MVLRALALRCPRCGGGKLFRNWFQLKERCPTCRYKIEREAGFWLGGYVMNVALGELALGAFLLYFASRVLSHPDMRIAPWLVTAVILAVVPPILLFPLSRTTWMAVDLLIHPLEPWEVADADLAREAGEAAT